MYERIAGYRRNLTNFVASVVLGGLAISFLSTNAFAIATGSVISGSGVVLGTFGVVFLMLSGYLYLNSQNPGLIERDSWDFVLRIRKDGSTGEDDWPPASLFRTAKFYVPIAYEQLLKASPEQRNEIFFPMPERNFPLPNSSIGVTSPLGDRMGANKDEKFASEFMDFLMLIWLSELQEDVVTVGGKVVQRIELFKGFDGQTYTPEQLQTGPAINRFVRLKVEVGLREIKLPFEMKISVLRSVGVFPKLVLTTKFAEMRLTYSIYQTQQGKEFFEANVRISFEASPKKTMWVPSFGRLRSSPSRFPSDAHYRSIDIMHEDLRKFFLPLWAQAGVSSTK
nr:hypothetical protein [Ferrimicrobium acidiphilum]